MSAPGASSSSGAASAAASSLTTTGGPGEKTLETLHFDNLALRTLPIDPEKKNYTREVPNACFSLVEPTPVKNPRLVCFSPDVLRWIELRPDQVARSDFADFFSGNRLLPGARPAAHCYCGHQFGHFSGQLGDGATMYLGEIVTSKGERIEIQFKGAGQTPYSRRADGRKVLRSSIREFLCSEANHYLGVPTTRAGTIVTSDTLVDRDIFYDGNTIHERATIITRLAHSFIRFGSFEIAKTTDAITGRKGPSAGNKAIVKTLLDYVVHTFYAGVIGGLTTDEEKYLAFFRELTRRTAIMVARWQTVGWCHGVLNTDNMSILGITIDYGPFAFMESFDPEFICNGSDDQGRYRYEAQPEICGWNLLKFSQNIEAFVPRAKLRAIVDEYEGIYNREYVRINKRKFGVGLYGPKAGQGAEEQKEPTTGDAAASPAASSTNASATDSAMSDEGKGEGAAAAAAAGGDDEQYSDLFASFYGTMASTGADFTNSFRCLSSFDPTSSSSRDSLLDSLVSHCGTLAAQMAALAPRIPPAQMAMIMQLMQRQPGVFQRPGMEDQLQMIQQEIDRTKQREALEHASQTDKSKEDRETWRGWVDQYAQVLLGEMTAGQQQGHTAASILATRRRHQNSANPKYILRNWIAQEVIQAAEKGDYAPMHECLQRLRDPYDVDDAGDAQQSAVGVASLEAASTRGVAHPSESVREPIQDADRHQPPAGTLCKLHWDKKRPDWANNLKVT